MRLRDLEAVFLKRDPDGKVFRQVETMAEADVVEFLCPFCYQKNGGEIGTHGVHVPFSREPFSRRPGPGGKIEPVWQATGTGLDDLTLNPSVDLGAGDWHGWVRDGDAT